MTEILVGWLRLWLVAVFWLLAFDLTCAFGFLDGEGLAFGLTSGLASVLAFGLASDLDFVFACGFGLALGFVDVGVVDLLAL